MPLATFIFKTLLILTDALSKIAKPEVLRSFTFNIGDLKFRDLAK